MKDEPADQRLRHRRVLAIAAPIVLSNATVPLLGLIDTGVVGRMGQAAPIGAVGLGAIILASVYWIFGFLRMGTTGLVAQAHGAGQPTGPHLLRALLIGLGAGAVFILFQPLLFAAAFRLAPATPEVEALARQYLGIRIWGAPATIGLYAINGWLIGVQRTRALLLLQLIVTGTNIVLDLLFVLGLGWGVPGVAAATLIAEWTGLGLGLWLTQGALAGARLAHGLADRTALRRMARVNADIMIRSVLLQACFTAFVFLGAGMGDVTLAANQVLLQLLEVMAFALDGFAFAAETLVGQAVGARQPLGVRRVAVLAGRLGAAGAALLGACFLLAGPWLIDLMTTAPAVREAARLYLPWLAAAPLIGIAGWMFDGIFIGATLGAEMRRAVTLSAAVFAATALVLPPLIGNHGLWAALMALNVCRGVVMWRMYPAAERAAA